MFGLSLLVRNFDRRTILQRLAHQVFLLMHLRQLGNRFAGRLDLRQRQSGELRQPLPQQVSGVLRLRRLHPDSCARQLRLGQLHLAVHAFFHAVAHHLLRPLGSVMLLLQDA